MPKLIDKAQLDRIKRSGRPEEYVFRGVTPFPEMSTVRAPDVLAGLEGTLEKGPVATLPVLAEKFIQYPDHNNWNELVVSGSEEFVTQDFEGKWLEKNKPLLLINHGQPLILPDTIYEDSLTVNYDSNIFSNYFRDEMIDGFSVKPIWLLEGAYDWYDLSAHQAHTVVLDFDVLKAIPYGNLTREQFVNHPLAIARLGAQKRAEDYFDAANINGKILLGRQDQPTDQGRGNFISFRNPKLNYGISIQSLKDHAVVMFTEGTDAKANK